MVSRSSIDRYGSRRRLPMAIPSETPIQCKAWPSGCVALCSSARSWPPRRLRTRPAHALRLASHGLPRQVRGGTQATGEDGAGRAQRRGPAGGCADPESPRRGAIQIDCTRTVEEIPSSPGGRLAATIGTVQASAASTSGVRMVPAMRSSFPESRRHGGLSSSTWLTPHLSRRRGLTPAHRRRRGGAERAGGATRQWRTVLPRKPGRRGVCARS